ncbi:MAG: Mor transcription activator family protein [Candidatus Contendobacter sp.]|nr:Mor transcription activator family protein [Candidatus Contendobacter sp.]
MLTLPDPYPETLAELAQLIHDQLQPRMGEDAGPQALRIVDALRRELGGSLIYIPKDTARARRQRNDAIVREFTGRNHDALARKYGVSTLHVYRLLAAARQRRQVALFV